MRVVFEEGDVQTLSLGIPGSRPSARAPVPCAPAGEDAVVVATEDGRAAATNLEGVATSLWTPPPPLRVQDVARDSDGKLYAVAPNGKGQTSLLLLEPDGSLDELVMLEGTFQHIAARGGSCWLRDDSVIMRVDRDRNSTEIVLNDPARYTISRETVGFDVDDDFNLYVGCIHSGIFRIHPDGSVLLVVPMESGANGLSIAANGHLYVTSNLCIFIRSVVPLAGHTKTVAR